MTGKSHGGGLRLYVSKNWCNTVMVRESLCPPDTELLSVFFSVIRFPQLFVTLVYIHPTANVDNATKFIGDTIHRLQGITQEPNFIASDFNHFKLGKLLSHFHQYVTCPTRNMKCLNLRHGSIRLAYKCFSRVPLGMSEHNVIYLVPICKPVLKERKPER